MKARVPGPFIHWTALVVPLLLASQASAQPNLTPYQPDGWTAKIVVSNVTGSTDSNAADVSPLKPTDTLYVNWAVINSGGAATAVQFYTELYVDGALLGSWYSDPPLDPNYYANVEDFSIGSLPVGTHTIRIKADSTGVIAESNESDNEYTKTITVGASGGCTANATTLCLNAGRFKVQAVWQALHLGTNGTGQAVSLTSDTGYFWFFSSGNVEAVIKVVDGTAVNGDFWVFYGALSNVQYTITVTDTTTGRSKAYFNPQDTLASVADTSAFSASSTAPIGTDAISVPAASAGKLLASAAPGIRPAATSQLTSVCTSDATTLCLNSGRFKVQATWQAVHLGTNGMGQAVPLTSDTGYFWFFSNSNVEAVIKVVDGTAVNGDFWVFYGALSNVQYTITVTDTTTGRSKAYFNAQDTLASAADTAAFPPVNSCTNSINPTSQSVGSSANSGVVAVTASVGCGWTATSGVTWINVDSGSSGSGNGSVSYSVQANTGSSQRTGALSIAGQAFTVTQAPSGTANYNLNGTVFSGATLVGWPMLGGSPPLTFTLTQSYNSLGGSAVWAGEGFPGQTCFVSEKLIGSIAGNSVSLTGTGSASGYCSWRGVNSGTIFGHMGACSTIYTLTTDGATMQGDYTNTGPGCAFGGASGSLAVALTPTVSSFRASASSVAPGQSFTLTWTTTNATSVAINGVEEPVNGSVATSIPAPGYYDYTLIATGSGGKTATAKLTMTVTGGANLCQTGYCYSYIWQVCCPRSAPYACNGQCYTYEGGGGCTDYRTTCY